MATFVFKTEPGEYSYTDLEREKRCIWSGIANAAALGHLRTAKTGDEVFIYHTGDEKAIVGLAVVAKSAYEDPKQPGKNAKGEPKNAVVDLRPVRPAKSPLTLAAIKADPRFAALPLVTQGRLSVMPVPAELAALLRSLTGL